MGKTSQSVACVTMLSVLLPYAAWAQTVPATDDGTIPTFRIQVWGDTAVEFTARMQGYFDLRGRLERRLPAVTTTDDVGELRRGQRSLAELIRAARPGAAQGEFFTAGTATEFQRVLAGIMTAAVWAVIMDENPGEFRRDIDGAYPDGKAFSTMPSIVLELLPQLPDDIQFRFVGRHLILYDVRANTIIDWLPRAIHCAKSPRCLSHPAVLTHGCATRAAAAGNPCP